MFNDVGKKIMVWAKVLCWIYIIAGIISFLLFGIQEEEWGIAFGCLLGGFAFVVSAWFLYGFGQMVDDIHSIRNSSKQAEEHATAKKEPVAADNSVENDLPDI